MQLNESLANAISNWLAQDPDEVTKKELEKLVNVASHGDGKAFLEIQDAFRAPLEFGTAGLRGALGPGPNRMNRITVLQAIGGLVAYLHQKGFTGQKVVIGYDARYNSEIFAKDSAEVLAGNGFIPVLFDHVVPTPVLAFAIRNLNACAGVMVTASHNPPQDNGYKVYLGDGRQIVPPADQEISTQIRKVEDIRKLAKSTNFEVVPKNCEIEYINSVNEIINSGPTDVSDRKKIKSVYTAMHWVGWQTLKAVFNSCEFNEPIAVIEQRDPDPAFPTVLFPNPEEKGALDLAIDQAIKENADLLLANDPDADRLAVAIPVENGNWKMLRGDQVGILLGWWVGERAKLTGQKVSGTLASSIVSSMMLKAIAIHSGFKYEHTLTGFKWVSRVPNLIYGYEEALGYCVDPENVGDKDGISAAAMFVELVASLKKEQKTIWQQLDELAIQFGLFVSDQISIRVTDITKVPQVMNNLRKNPPKSFGSLIVGSTIDLNTPESGLPPTDGIIFYLIGTNEISSGRVVVRPSGTEPKIKCYLEVVVNSKELESSRVIAENELVAISRDATPLLTGANNGS